MFGSIFHWYGKRIFVTPKIEFFDEYGMKNVEL
jgi:hypothetical protein